MIPDSEQLVGVGGISTVITKYYEHMPKHGVTFVGPTDHYDVQLVHAGVTNFDSPRGCNVASLHGMYWTGDHPAMTKPHYVANARITENIRQALVVTVPSEWVAQTIRREFRINPYIVPHGVDIADWEGGRDEGFVLWAKNTVSNVCDPTPVIEASKILTNVPFVSTFGPNTSNFSAKGAPFTEQEMRKVMLGCSVYLSTSQETFGIATLEAMAAGKPVVAFNTGFQPVIHRVTGYIARNGDIDDFVHGIKWAMEHKERLGQNAKMVAANYTWDKACLAMIEAMMAAEDLTKRNKTVTVVIPYRNKGHVLREAIDSALTQQCSEPVKVIVVDDASDDQIAKEMTDAYSKKQVKYVRLQERSGVAVARNVGIDLALGEYIVCLDADDMMAPGYIDTCYRKLAHDRSIGIAYTGLGQIHEKGIVKSEWPGEFDFWRQAAGHNQVPTAAMFRKEMWRRVGGYRARYTRYARLGFGSEDAAFWLHGTAIGYRAVQVTPEPLFWYRPGGSTSRSGYRELPWHNFYHWDALGYPAGAPPKGTIPSWPVNIYDPPNVSVIIPVGPGHEGYLPDAIDSVEAQSYRRVEVIVVWDSPEKIPSWYTTGYPYVKFIKGKGSMGAGAARNLGASKARTEFVVFLDSDDMMLAGFLESAVREWNKHRAIIYTDYIGSHDIPEGQDPKKLKGYTGHDPLMGVAYNRNRLYDFDPEKAKRQPEEIPYVWSLVTCFLPLKWFKAIGGFKEDLESWEDWDLHVRLAKAGYPYFHLKDWLLHYRENLGKRSTEAELRWKEWNLPERIG
jgi:glycosyltransferase involved in cell wall biosynthesis